MIDLESFYPDRSDINITLSEDGHINVTKDHKIIKTFVCDSTIYWNIAKWCIDGLRRGY